MSGHNILGFAAALGGSLVGLAEADVALASEEHDVFFDFDRDTPLSSSDLALRAVAERADRDRGAKLVIAGFCDERGTGPYNVALAIRRARAVHARLIELGVAPDRLVMAFYGEDGPRRRSYAEDRRVTLTLTEEPLHVIIEDRLADATGLTWSRPVTVADIEGPTRMALRDSRNRIQL